MFVPPLRLWLTYDSSASGRYRKSIHQGARLDGFQATRTRGSHHVYRHSDGRRVVVAYHRLSATFPVGTLKGMITDAGWTDDDLLRLGLLN